MACVGDLRVPGQLTHRETVPVGREERDLVPLDLDPYSGQDRQGVAPVGGDRHLSHGLGEGVTGDRGGTLPILTGVRVEIEGDKITLLATDRYRLAMRELTWNPEVTDASHVALVPARTLSDLSLIHISEPTRQAEISYAVFCFNKNKKLISNR